MTLCGVALNGPSRSTTTAVFWLERYFVVSNKWQTISPWHRINRLRVRAEYFHIRFPVFKSTMQFWFCVLCGSCPLFCTISIEIQIQIHNGRFTGQICRWQLGHRINWMIYRYGVCMSCHTHTHSIRYFVHSRRTKGKEIVFATKHVVVVPLLGLASYAHNCVCHTKFRKCHRHLHLTLMCYVFCVLHSFVNRYAKSLTFLLDTKRARCTPVRYHTILWCTRIWTMNVLETCHT